MTETEQHAILTDATQRLAELHAVRAILQPDAADPAVAAELAQIASQIAAAEKALDNDQSHPVASTAQPTRRNRPHLGVRNRSLSNTSPAATSSHPPVGESERVQATAFTPAVKDFPPRGGFRRKPEGFG